jgi:predicted nucleic acid-binding protein
MALVMPVFFDTSFLLAALIDFGPQSIPAQRVMDAIADKKIKSAATAWHCCLEFYAVSTRLPPEFRLSPEDARQLIEEEILARFEVHQLQDSDWRAFFHSAGSERIAGGRIYDSHIAEIARRSGARQVVTENTRHFGSLMQYGIHVMTGREFAGEL